MCPADHQEARHAVLHAIHVIAADPEAADDGVVQALAATGVSPLEAELLMVFVPSAFGLVLAEHLGVRTLPTTYIVQDAGGVWRSRPLAEQPYFTAALSVACEVMERGWGDPIDQAVFEACAYRSAEIASVNAALNAGVDVKGSQLGPLTLLRLRAEDMAAARPIDLATPLSLATSFRFPLQSPAARREVWIGAAVLLLPGVGWLLNMGHRVMMVHRMMAGAPAWPAWTAPATLLRHGVLTFGGMLYYAAPGLLMGALGYATGHRAMVVLGALLLVLALLMIPGYMTHYCRAFDPREIYHPLRALSRVVQGGRAYWHAWGIALAALALSLAGLLAAGVGFLVTSVWFWQVAGFSFARVFAQAPRNGSLSPGSSPDTKSGRTVREGPPDHG